MELALQSVLSGFLFYRLLTSEVYSGSLSDLVVICEDRFVQNHAVILVLRMYLLTVINILVSVLDSLSVAVQQSVVYL